MGERALQIFNYFVSWSENYIMYWWKILIINHEWFLFERKWLRNGWNIKKETPEFRTTPISWNYLNGPLVCIAPSSGHSPQGDRRNLPTEEISESSQCTYVRSGSLRLQGPLIYVHTCMNMLVNNTACKEIEWEGEKIIRRRNCGENGLDSQTWLVANKPTTTTYILPSHGGHPLT